MLPAPYYSYDLIVEGPEGIEYVDAVASTDEYYHWNYNQGEPHWIREWGLKNRSFSGKSSTSYRKSKEYQNRPEQFGKTGETSLSKNFMISRQLQENIRSKIVTRPRVVEQPREDDYGTATCYFYVVSAPVSPQPVPPVQQAPQPTHPSYPSHQDYLNRMHQDFKQIPGVDITPAQNSLIVRMPGSGLFDTDSYALRYEARRDLDRVADVLLRYKDTRVTVAGHTDSIGDANYNQRLSEYRAQTVANYLVSQGVPAYRLSSVGYGETMPIDSNATESGRRLNRRIELIVSLDQQYGM
jgi:outer membrane protein OmpA-like peptidoglycan-associated protein